MMKSLGKRYSEIMSNKTKGFTLMELVVVIGVMAILALVMVPNLTAYIQKADDAKNQANMKSVHTAAELAVQSNPNIYVRDIVTDTAHGGTVLSGQIATYANLKDDEVSVVATAGTNEKVYYVSPDTDGTRIVVTYNTDRATYVFDGKNVSKTASR